MSEVSSLVVDYPTLRALAGEEGGPHVSVFVPTHRTGPETRQDLVRLENLLEVGGEMLAARGHGKRAVASLLRPAIEILADEPFWRHREDGLAMYLAPAVAMRIFSVPFSLQERVVVDTRFHVRPLLPALSGDGVFHILELNKKVPRLFAASRETACELPVPALEDLAEESLRVDNPQNAFQLHGHRLGPAASAHAEAVRHGTGPGSDFEKRYMVSYCQRVDDATLPMTRSAPLVVLATDPLMGIFREATRHRDVLVLPGNHDQESASQLHALAWSAMAPRFAEPEREASERLAVGLHHGWATAALDEVLIAANDGRVETLFVPSGDARWGRYDASARRVYLDVGPSPSCTDLIDLAAAMALRTDGTIFAPRPEVAAILRY